VFVGFDRMSEQNNEVSIGLGQIFVHPGFTAYPVPTNDIALIKLAGKLLRS